MKFRKIGEGEMQLIKNCTDKFKGKIELDKFIFFTDKFNKVYIYAGMPINLKGLKVLSMGLYVGKFEKDNTFNTFAPSQEFLDIIKPTEYVFEIENTEDAVNFMKGQDVCSFWAGNKKKWMIKANITQNFEDGALIAVKYKNAFLGVGKFSNGMIINKISKRRKLH